MEQQNRNDQLEREEKNKKRKKFSFLILLIIILVIVVVYLQYKLMQSEYDNLELKYNNNSSYINKTECDSAESNVKIVISSFLENDKYSLFFKFLIFLGFLYIIQIGISGALDIVELSVMGFLLLRELYRTPSKIIKYFKKENNDKQDNNLHTNQY